MLFISSQFFFGQRQFKFSFFNALHKIAQKSWKCHEAPNILYKIV